MPGRLFGFLLILLMLFVACSENGSYSSDPATVKEDQATAKEDRATADEGEVKAVEIPIGGMSCMSCVARVKKTLSGIDGVKETKVSLEDKNARIIYDPEKVSPEQLKNAISEIGYKAGDIKE